MGRQLVHTKEVTEMSKGKENPEKQAGGTPSEGAGDQTGEEKVSRRGFMRRSAEVAAFSLFGIVGFDSVVDGVMRQISERRSIAELGSATAQEFRKHTQAWGASGRITPACVAPAFECTGDNHPCERPYYYCKDTSVTCVDITHMCNLNPYGCTGEREHHCISHFNCYEADNCHINFWCDVDKNCVPDTAYHNC
jgi:hypothetical protein